MEMFGLLPAAQRSLDFDVIEKGGKLNSMFDQLSPANLIIGPRPGKKSFDRLSALGLTHCCTLLSEHESPHLIENISTCLGCEWLWLPITGGGLDTLASTPMADHLQTLSDALSGVERPKIYLHCSAGLHRTGYVAHILLRIMGLDQTEALNALMALRPVTAEQVGADRISLAEMFLQGYSSI